MEEKSSQKAYERVFDYFTAEITSGNLRLNDKIPTERALSETLKVSRNSAREALHVLEMMGLIECIQGSGNYIRCNTREYMTKLMSLTMVLQHINHTEVFEMRCGFEQIGPCGSNGRRSAGRACPHEGDSGKDGSAHERTGQRSPGCEVPQDSNGDVPQPADDLLRRPDGGSAEAVCKGSEIVDPFGPPAVPPCYARHTGTFTKRLWPTMRQQAQKP